MQAILETLWQNDTNRLRPHLLALNTGGKNPGSKTDMASKKLFQWVDYTAINRPSYQSLKALFDNYEPRLGTPEDDTPDEAIEIETFLDDVINTQVMDIARTFLSTEGITVAETQQSFKEELKRLWFTNYMRHTPNDSSGFEHVFIGELNPITREIGGFHNWHRFYELENAGEIDYAGYKQRQTSCIAMASRWGSYWKLCGSFWIGTSPEFELAAYTVCFLMGKRTNQKTFSFYVDQQSFTIMVIPKNNTYICTAYVTPG